MASAASPPGNGAAGGCGGGILDLVVPKKKGRTVLLKSRVMIPEYLRKAMCDAVATSGAAYLDGASAVVDRQEEEHTAPDSPLIVFVNSKSGGRLGPALASHLRDLISPDQVFDLNETKPTEFVRYGLGCLDALAKNGDECARQTRERLRILVAGGDGTVGWVLGSLAELNVEHRGPCPPVGIIPLGTGNDLARSFGWVSGSSFTSKGRAAVKDWLLKATEGSTPQPLDCWKVTIRTSSKKAIKWPHALKPQQHLPLPTEGEEQDEYSASFEGVFYNYFSLGMDAQVAYGFHELRNRMPWLARGPVANKMIYSGYSCWQGWFCTSLSTNPRARGVSTVLRLSVRKNHEAEWEEVHVPSSVRAVVILNLQSYAGGRNPWGHPKLEKMEKNGFVEAKPNDGYLELFGLRDGWHTSLVLLSLLKAVRLAQAEAVRLELHGEKRDRAYMQMDGEPWKHPLSPDGKPVIVEIGRVSMPSTMLKAA